jgi:hypothetical protein
MPRLPSFARQAFFVILALLLAAFFQFRSAAAGFTFLAHRPTVDIGRIVISAAILYVLLIGLWALSSHFLARSSGAPYKEALDLDLWTWAPLLFLALTPLALRHYLTRDDFSARLGLWLTAVLLAVFNLKVARWREIGRARPLRWRPLIDRFLALESKKKLPLLFLTALVVYNAGSVLLSSKGITFSGDEPHYILNAHSLIEDGDLDLANNYQNADYKAYTPDNVLIQPHTVAGAKPGSRYSFHSPGLSFYLVPFYALGRAWGENALVFLLRFAMTLLGALFGLQIYLFARSEWGRERLALGLWFLASFTSPIFFYSLHLYPELVVALFSLTVFRLFRFSEKLTTAKLLLCGFLLPAFIWLHALKYFFIMVPLFLYCAWRLLKKKTGVAGWGAFLAFPVLMAGLYLAFSYALYGSLNPTSVSWQGPMDGKETLGFLKMLFTGIPFRFRLDTLAGYFLDQRDGLLLYAPVYFFAFLGLVEMFRRKAKDAWLILAIAAPYALVSAFLTQRTGYAPQARPLVAALWALIIFLGYYLAAERKRGFAFLFNGAVGTSLLFVWLLLRNPLALYQETTQGATDRGGGLFYILSNLHHSLTKILPSFLKVEEWRWTPNFIWPALLAVFILVYLTVRKAGSRWKFGRHMAVAGVLLAGFFVWFVNVPRTVLYSPRSTVLPTGESLQFYSLSRAAIMHQPARFSLLEDNRDYNFYFASRRPLKNLRIDFGSRQGDYDLGLGFWDEHPDNHPTRRVLDALTFADPPFYRLKGNFLYRVSIRVENKSGVKTGANPYQFAITPVR